MTVGSKSTDLTYPYGNGLAGTRFSKTWSGGDYPKVATQKGSPKAPPKRVPGYVTSLIRDLPDGKWVKIGKEYSVPARRVRPPRRARQEEHPYDCTVNHQVFPGSGELFTPTTGLWSPLATDTGTAPVPGITSAWTANDDIALLGKLREKVVGSGFNLGVFLAEGRQSLGMVASAASRIYGAVNAAHRGNFGRAAHILTDGTEREILRKRRAVATNWLELQYGWLPLINDAYEGATFLADLLNVPMQQRYVARRRVPVSIRPSSPNWRYSSSSAVERGQIIAFLKQKDTVLLSGLTDPASIVWEKIPYSFVVDWFIPIGNYLAAHALARALVGTFVTTRTSVYLAEGLVATGAWTGLVRGDLAGFYWFRMVTSRSVSTTLKVPLPTTKPLSKVASWRHCANAVALLTTARAGSKLQDLWSRANAGNSVIKDALRGRRIEYTE